MINENDTQELVKMIKQAYEIVEEAIPNLASSTISNDSLKATALGFVLGKMGQKDTIDAMTQFTDRFQNILDPKQKTEDETVRSPDFVIEALNELDKNKDRKK